MLAPYSPSSLKDLGQVFPTSGTTSRDEGHRSESPGPISGPDVSPIDDVASQHKPMPKEPVFLEICAGSARVTTCLSKSWFALFIWGRS